MARNWYDSVVPEDAAAPAREIDVSVAHPARVSEEAGIGQFLDIGTGIPTASNTHEVAQAVQPGARVVYVDNDPIVLAHARALLTSSAGPTAFIDTDLRDAAAILAGAAQTLDFSQPVAPMRRRTRDEVARFFGGLDLVEPGIVQMHQWRPTGQETAAP